MCRSEEPGSGERGAGAARMTGGAESMESRGRDVFWIFVFWLVGRLDVGSWGIR
jgi:hypothetical protein